MNEERGTREIICKRGLRQGDPLFPLMFTLVTYDLDKIIRKLENAGLIEGLNASKGIKLTNLQYADNILLFGKKKCRSNNYTKCIMHTFEL